MDAWWRVKPRQHYWIAYCNDHKPEPGHVNSDMVWMLGERGDRLAEALEAILSALQTQHGKHWQIPTGGHKAFGEACDRAVELLERDR